MAHPPLSARHVWTLGDGFHRFDRNLYLEVSNNGAGRSWVYRYSFAGQQHSPGLGPAHIIGLAKARELAREMGEQRLRGIDPLQAKRERRDELRLATVKQTTFGQCVETFLEFKRPEWTNPKHVAQWEMTLRHYAKPLHPLSPEAIDLALIVQTLRPIWTKIPETAGRTRQRIEAVLDHWAATNGIHDYVNPAAWERVKHALPSLAKIKKQEHHSALAYSELPAFMAELRSRDSLSARALELTILCICRTSETIGAEWSEIDFEAKTWTVPKERTKTKREHKIPLAARAVAILQQLPRNKPRIFELSNMAMLELLRGMRPGLTVHGMRACFRTWCSEVSSFPHEVCEQALAHRIPEAVVRAYQRGTLFEKRRRLMTAWDQYCAKLPPAVIPLHRVS